MQDFNFYKVNETLNHKYYQIPQELFINPLYKNALNSDSKLLYGFLLDRLFLSIKNNWHDEKLNLSDKTVKNNKTNKNSMRYSGREYSPEFLNSLYATV